jgi:2-C-methyl-D-erythritol 4-phosphate cytidylyltransferase
MSAEVPKQYLKLHGSTVLHHTLSRICANPEIKGVVIGISPEDCWWSKDEFTHTKLLGIYQGGAERADTVLNGLQYLDSLDLVSRSDWVLVHDAARPCIVQQDIHNLLASARVNGVGAVLGKTLIDTIKSVDEKNIVRNTVDREQLCRAFTPQVFRIGKLIQAIEDSVHAGIKLTDESMAMERSGMYPVLVEGHASNIKITTSGDLDLMELYLAEYQ